MDEAPHNIARDLIRLGDLDGATRIMEASGDQGSSADVWAMRLIRADLLRLRGHTEDALAYLSYKEAAFPPEASDLFSQICLKKTRGYFLGQLGKYAPSHGFFQEAERMATGAGLLEPLCEVHQCQAMIFYIQKNHQESDRIYRVLLRASEQVGGWYFRANALWGIGKNLMAQGHHLEALPWFEQSHALSESAGSRRMMATAWGDMAVCYLGLGDDRKSLELLENALRVHSEVGRVQSYLIALANIGNVYLYRGDYLRAIDYYRRALELAYEIKDSVSIQKWSRNVRLGYARLRESVDRLDSRTA